MTNSQPGRERPRCAGATRTTDLAGARPAARGAILVLLLATALSGCTSFELTRVRNSVDETPGVEVGDGYAVSFGRLSVGTLRQGLRLSDDDEQTEAVRQALRHVRKAQFARYALDAAPPLADLETPSVVDRYRRRGWTPAVAARDDDAAVWLLAKDSKRGELRDLLLVTVLPRELIVAKLSGDLTEAAGAFFQAVDVAGLDDLLGTPSADTTATLRSTPDELPSDNKADGL